MKAKLHGIEIEGTPEEVAQVIKLVASQPLPPTIYPVYPNPYAPQPYSPWANPPVWCDITKPGSGQTLYRDDAGMQAWN